MDGHFLHCKDFAIMFDIDHDGANTCSIAQMCSASVNIPNMMGM